MQDLIKTAKIIVLAFVIAAGASYVYAWTGPTGTPPAGNVDSPINVSAASQYKDGALGVGGLFRGYANAIFDGTIVGANRFDVNYPTSNVYDNTTSDSPYSRVDADSFHTNGLGVGQIFIEGRAIDSNTWIGIGAGLAGGQTANNVTIGDTAGPDSGLKLDVEGRVGATEYCDQNGQNCVAAAGFGSGGGGPLAISSRFTGGSFSFNKPAGATKAHVKIHGGGAAGVNYTGGNYGGVGGASGAYAERIINVSSINSLSGSVGAGGVPSGGRGGNTVLTGYMTAGGGVGTTRGVASGGHLNFNGENGYAASGGYMGGPGGNGYHGGSGSARGPHVAGTAGRKGAGGAGGSGYAGTKLGGNGGNGFVIIYWY